METSQLICFANHLTGFYMMATLAFNELIKQLRALCKFTILNVKVKKTVKMLKMFILYEKGVAEKLKRVASKNGLTTVFTKKKT